MSLQLPIGYENFAEIRTNKLDLVDKTLFIQAILDDIVTKVILITRPRRFGKTLNLSMLHCFFAAEVYGYPTQRLFDGMNITKTGSAYMQHQGRYPVVFLTLKNVKGMTYEHIYGGFCKVLSQLYGQYRFLLESPKLHDDQKKVYRSILEQNATLPNIETALQDLTLYLHAHYGIAPTILIDEYDTPIQSAYLNGYYKEIIQLFRHFFGAGLKGNPHFHKAILTGILLISKENLFSDLNNINIYSVLDSNYSEYFGFTETETTQLLEQSGLQNKATDIKNWYNGYQIGDTILYNPWSIVNCIQKKGILKPYWVNTSDNALVKDSLLYSGVAFKEQFANLMKGEPISSLIDERFVFSDLKKNKAAAIWTLLLMAGYLKVLTCQYDEENITCQLAIPNREVRGVYLRIIEEWLSNGYGIQWYTQFLQRLLNGDLEAFERDLAHILEKTVSVHDVGVEPEAFYHGLMIGLTASLYNNPEYETKSNREAGYGRYDLMIFSKNPEKLTLLFEFKKAESKKGKKGLVAFKTLQETAQHALLQIQERGYLAEAQQRGAQNILNIGIAFAGKRFSMAYQHIYTP